MGKGRLEAFSDGVLAIIITIMVLEMKVPHGNDLSSLRSLGPTFLSYVLSFIYVGIYWNNHHHMLAATERVNGSVLWVNLHLLFWLSLFPFSTAWMGENHFAVWPVVVYGFVLAMAAVAYYILSRALIRQHGENSALSRALGRDFKGKLSVAVYAVAIPLAFLSRWIAVALYVLVSILWLVPDRRMEKVVQQRNSEP